MPGVEEQAVGLASMAVLSCIPAPPHVPPQVRRVVSWGLLPAVACLSTTYGFIIDKAPLYIANAICIGNTCLLALMKRLYGPATGEGDGDGQA